MPRSAPVYHALLAREGVLPDSRKEALEGLAKINKADVPTELFAAIQRIDGTENLPAAHVLTDLAGVLATRPAAELAVIRPQLERLAAEAHQPVTRPIAFGTMATAAGNFD